MENKGVIYILTNPSFPEYVKIGYAVKCSIAGPRFFKYNGEWLNAIRHRLGA